MKRLLLLIAVFLGISAGAAQATCPGPAVMKDNAGTSFNMNLTQDAGNGNCDSSVAVASGVPDSTSAISITSSTASTGLALFGTQSVQFNLTGTFSATVFGQISNDSTNGTNGTWVNVPILNMTTGAWVAPGTGVTAVGNYALAGTQGARYARVNVTFVSGTVAGNMTATTQGPSATWGDYLTWLAVTGAVPCIAGTVPTTQSGVSTGTITKAQCDLNGNLYANPVSDYPAGATASNGSNTGTTAATATTLPAVSSVTQYVCWISIRANATVAATGNATLSDGTKTFNFTQWTAPLASGVGIVEEIFPKCIPASAVNTAWTLTSAAPGSGGVVSVAIGGYSK